MAEEIGGIVSVTVNGRSITVGDAVSFNPGGVTKTEVVTKSGRVNYTTANVPAFVEVEVHTDSQFNPRDLEALDNATIHTEWGGQLWTFGGAFYTGPQDIDPTAGTTTVKFVGDPATKA